MTSPLPRWGRATAEVSGFLGWGSPDPTQPLCTPSGREEERQLTVADLREFPTAQTPRLLTLDLCPPAPGDPWCPESGVFLF